MKPSEKLIQMAESQVGYLEKSKAAYEADPGVLDEFTRGAGMDNYTKYARDQWQERYFNSSKQGVAWCAVFVGWCFLKCFGKNTALALQCQPKSGNAGAGCGAASNYYKAQGRWMTEPAEGDQIFFTNGSEVSHTGIVRKVESGKVYTIEGNSDGGVRRHSYSIGSARIVGYGHPDWGVVPADSANYTVEISKEKEKEVNMRKDAVVVQTSTSKGKTVNLRLSASTDAGSKVLAQVPFGSHIEVLKDEGQWCMVSYGDKTGWMMSNYIEYTGRADESSGNVTQLSDNDCEQVGGYLKQLSDLQGDLDSIGVMVDSMRKRLVDIEDGIGGIVGRG